MANVLDYPVITISELKKDANALIGLVAKAKGKLYITVRGKVVAVIEPVEQRGIVS